MSDPLTPERLEDLEDDFRDLGFICVLPLIRAAKANQALVAALRETLAIAVRNEGGEYIRRARAALALAGAEGRS